MGKEQGNAAQLRTCKGSAEPGGYLRDAYNMGIKYLTVYLFSTENWKRSPDEVDAADEAVSQIYKDLYRPRATIT